MIAIVIVAAVFAVAGFLYSSIFIPKEYQAWTTIIVGKPETMAMQGRIDYNDIMVNQKLVTTYKEIMKSDVVVNKVIKNLNLDMDAAEFKSMLTIGNVSDTEIISITITDTQFYLKKGGANVSLPEGENYKTSRKG